MRPPRDVGRLARFGTQHALSFRPLIVVGSRLRQAILTRGAVFDVSLRLAKFRARLFAVEQNVEIDVAAIG